MSERGSDDKNPEQASNPVPTKQCYKKPRQVISFNIFSFLVHWWFTHVFWHVPSFWHNLDCPQFLFKNLRAGLQDWLLNIISLLDTAFLQVCQTLVSAKPKVKSDIRWWSWTKGLHQVVTAKIPKQVCGHSSEFTKGKKSPIKRYSMRKYHKQIF